MTTTVLAYIPSPSQGVWHVGPFPIRAYALFIIAGIVVALLIGDRRWAARGGERGVIYDISLWAVPFGLIGGRIYHVITDWPKYFGDGGAGIIGVLRIWDGGLGIWGAVALGGVGAWIACRRRGIPLPAFGDAIAPGIVLAQAIGRLGNYFNQELYGRPTTLPWGLEIYERRNSTGVVSPDLANGVSTGQLASIVHPTFLYELLWNLLVFAVLIWVDRKFKIGHGRLFALYVAGYCLGRFWVELLRSDQATLIADIRVNSFTSTFLFIGAVVYIMVAPKGREDPETLKGWARDDEEEESPVSVLAEEMTAVGATSGVVAAAKAAGDAEDEDAEAAGASPPDDEEPKSEVAAEADDLAQAVAEAPDEQIVEAEEFAEAIKESDEAEAADEAERAEGDQDEAEELGADVAGVPADSVAEAEEFATEGEEPGPAEGVVEGDEVLEAESDQLAAELDTAAEELAAEEAEQSDEAEAVGGVGAVEGDEVLEAAEAAPEVREAALEGEAEAQELAAETAADAAEEDAPETPETEAADANDGDEAEQSEQAEESEEDAPDAAEETSSTEVDSTAEAKPTPAPAEPAEESGGRLRRWLRRRSG